MISKFLNCRCTYIFNLIIFSNFFTKRKYKKVSVYEEKVKLKGCKNEFRQIIVKDQGRVNPTYIITNDHNIKITELLTVYAKRWHVENKLGELVAFFNLNALSTDDSYSL